MTLKADIELKLRRFFRKYWKIIVIALVIVIIIIGIDRIIKLTMDNEKPETTYTPNISVLDSTSSVPKKVHKSVEDFIDEYVNYCNNKEYESAYAMLSKDCQNDYFGSLSDFKLYVNNKFYEPRKYAIQSYSIFNKKYVYIIKLFDDILSTGLTGTQYKFQEEKMVAYYDENKKLVFNVGNFIEKNPIESVQENQYIKVDVKYQIIKYEFEQYNIKLTNKSNYKVIIQNSESENSEVVINLGQEERPNNDTDYIILEPGESTTIMPVFQKFWDDGDTTKEIQFTSVRVIDENENVVDKLSMTMGI